MYATSPQAPVRAGRIRAAAWERVDFGRRAMVDGSSESKFLMDCEGRDMSASSCLLKASLRA
jgi:hypothetical protein